MEKLSREDGLMLENFTLKGALLDARCAAINEECARFRAERDAHAQEMRAKYDLAEGDGVDYTALTITRAPKPKAEARPEIVIKPKVKAVRPVGETKAA